MRVKIEGEDRGGGGSPRRDKRRAGVHGAVTEAQRTKVEGSRGTAWVGGKVRGAEGPGGEVGGPVDGDSTKQRCLIGVGPHQVDRGPPSRVFEGSTPTTRTTTTWGLRSRDGGRGRKRNRGGYQGEREAAPYR